MSTDDVRGKTVHDVYPRERAIPAAEHDRRTIESAQSSEREALVPVGGQQRIYSVSKFPVVDARGEVVAVGSISTDIAQRKRIERERDDNERLLTTLMSNLPGMVYRVRYDRQRFVEFVSEGCYDLTGYAPEEVIGRRGSFLDELAHSDDRERMRDYARHCIEDRGPFQISYRIVTASGDVKWVWEQGRGVYDDSGRLLSVEGFLTDITEARSLSEKLSHQASHDALTGLLNRCAFEERLNDAIESSRDGDHEHALCYLDLDQFKVINDTCGHVAGDELLRQLGELLPKKIRKSDTLARLGGDEFGLLMEDCSLEQASRVATALREVVEEYRFAWEDRSFALGVSIGLASINSSSASVADVLSAVDSACYVVKDHGRNRVHVYRPDDAELMRRHGEMQWISRITQALEEDRLQLVFQPIVPVSGEDRGHHYELLMRMVGDDGELIPPGAFLPAAERYNLSARLDRWAFSAALRWLADRPRHLDELHLCAVNLSGHSLVDPDYLGFVLRCFEETGISPEKFCFEITETVAIANLTHAVRFIHSLRERGSLFALDDFGSGLSSFAYLKTLPVDFLKIDGVFVKDIVDDPIDLAMVRSIHEIGRVMGKKTIAEFVENEQILNVLREIGVDYAQGYGLGRPQPLDALDR